MVSVTTPREADILLRNGRFITMNGNRPSADAVAVRNGLIQAVGSQATIAPYAGPHTQVIDLEGRVAIPGLTDCHVHLASDAARGIDAFDCRDLYDPSIRSTRDIARRVRERANESAPGTWVVGRGSPMQEYRLAEGRLPTKAELDDASPDRPAYVTFGAHVLIANSLAINERGVGVHTPDPQGGRIVREASSAAPTGEFRERAQYLIKAKVADAPPEDIAERILLELEKCAARGVTRIHDIITDRREVQAYQILHQGGRLPVRADLIIRVIESGFETWSLEDLGLMQGFGSPWLALGGIKMSIDGGFSGKNAAFSEALNTPESNPGLIRIKQVELDDTVERYHNAGMRICTHAIGDVAMDMVLRSYERALTLNPRTDHRHRVEHMGNWMMTPPRIGAARDLGVLPVPNPGFLRFVGDPLLELLQRRVSESGFPFKELWRSGFPLTFGSDAPGYYPVDPLRDAGVAVARETVGGVTVAQEEQLGIAEALSAVTKNAAYGGFHETEEGQIADGFRADIAVLDGSPYDTAPVGYATLSVWNTMCGGTWTGSHS